MSDEMHWRTLIEHLEALPERQKRFLSFDYDGYTNEGEVCGCLVGQLAKMEEIPISEENRSDLMPRVAAALGVPLHVMRAAEYHNDRYNRQVNEEEVCRARYRYMLAALTKFERGEEFEPDED